MASLAELIRSDIQKYADQAQSFQGRRPGMLRAIGILLTPSLISCTIHRVAHAAHQRGWKRLAWDLAGANARLHKILIDPGATIGPGMYIPHPVGVTFRGRAGSNLTLFVGATVGPQEFLPFPSNSLDRCPQLGDDVAIGVHSSVLGEASIGSRVTIVPGVVVLESVGSDRLVVGRSR
jgi:serine O-acetyltransferase